MTFLLCIIIFLLCWMIFPEFIGDVIALFFWGGITLGMFAMVFLWLASIAA